jgi:hypothetical protein
MNPLLLGVSHLEHISLDRPRRLLRSRVVEGRSCVGVRPSGSVSGFGLGGQERW